MDYTDKNGFYERAICPASLDDFLKASYELPVLEMPQQLRLSSSRKPPFSQLGDVDPRFHTQDAVGMSDGRYTAGLEIGKIGRILLLSLVLKKVHDSKCFIPSPHRLLKALL